MDLFAQLNLRACLGPVNLGSVNDELAARSLNERGNRLASSAKRTRLKFVSTHARAFSSQRVARMLAR
jgi:hypothetical protein